MKHESLSASAGAKLSGNGAPTGGADSGVSTRSGVAREYQAFLTEVEEMLSSATSMTAEDFARAKATLSARISAARAALGSGGITLAERARRTTRASDLYVRNQPWRAVGISAVAGLLTGLLLGRRGS